MIETMEGALDARGARFGLLASRFNSFVVDRLIEGATDCLTRHGARAEDLALVRVPGTWEMPLTAKWMAASGRFDAIVALGCVIRGSTPHFDFVAGEATKGLAAVASAAGVPIALGVLTTESIEQAIERAGTKMGNKGFEAALAAIEMVQLRRVLGEGDGGASRRT